MNVEVVLVNNERVTLRIGDTFLKVDSDPRRIEFESQMIKTVPVKTPEVLWLRGNVLALGAVDGQPLGKLGEQATSSSAAWEATGATIRRLHDSEAPSQLSKSIVEPGARLEAEAGWLVETNVLPREVISRHLSIAELAIRPYEPAFIHGDLHIEHVFVEGAHVAGIIDWSEAGRGDPLYDLATLTLGHPERLDAVVSGYGSDVDRSVIASWWSWRCLVVIRWLLENGYGSPAELPEVALLHAR